MGRWNSRSRRIAVPAEVAEGEMPAIIKPQLATAAAHPPEYGDWCYEIKFDGYRMLTRIDGGDIRFLTRNGHDWSGRLPRLVQAVRELNVRNAWLDGEVVVLNAAGRPDFNLLQNAFDSRSTADIVMFAFDLLWLNGEDLRPLPLRERRQQLRSLLEPVEGLLLRFSEDFEQDPHSLLASASKLRLEGMMGKRADAPYRSGRGKDWIKLKTGLRQEFVIGGYTSPPRTSTGVDALLLGVYELDGSLRFAGGVLPYFPSRTAASFQRRAAKREQDASPFRKAPKPERGRDYHWLKPEMVCEVSFVEWTKSGEMRHPIFHGLRTDKPAREVTVEVPVDVDDARPLVEDVAARGAITVAGIKITNAGRVIDASAGHTKLEVVRYYEAIAEWALPYLHDRPLSLVRAPDGIAGELFFQKHSDQSTIPGVEELPASLHPGHAPLLVANTEKALVGLAQMGVLELHSWNAVAPDLEHPDRVVFDLDPDPALPWTAMLEAASLVKLVLDELGLVSFPKTSGGKGIHIAVPLTRRQGWDEVKAFSKAVAQHMAKVVPSRFSSVSGPRNRIGKIFIDYLRNSKGATSVAAFSVRARPGMGVSMPVSWDEVPSLKAADQWNMRAAVARQRHLGGDAWQNYFKVRQGITAAMRDALGLK
ncbi:TPA: DNA ligase D [Burkholderia vietnamiensis]|nr:DNA ligase D [Burkholderia vietnamiensis]